jgi:hypothetical protein
MALQSVAPCHVSIEGDGEKERSTEGKEAKVLSVTGRALEQGEHDEGEDGAEHGAFQSLGTSDRIGSDTVVAMWSRWGMGPDDA